MPLSRAFSRREIIVLALLSVAVLGTVLYAAATYQTPYGCDASGEASGPGIDWQVFAKPCIYVYFTGIVGGSTIMILLIPATGKKSKAHPGISLHDNL